jgi:hypothetical protein
MIIDFYEELPGQPLTCIINVSSKDLQRSGERIKLPEYLEIEQDITDLKDWYSISLAMRKS